MIQSVLNAFKIRELRDRIFFTLAMVAVFRLGCQIPTPGVNPKALADLFKASGSNVLGMFNLFSGGALERFSVFALGIAPYINSSIIMQLLVYVVPALEHMAKEEGEDGRRKISQYTRYGTILIGGLQAFGISVWLENMAAGSTGGMRIVYEPGWGFRFIAVLSLTAGTAFIMWLGEQMTAMGIGNGVSLLITAGIVSRLPSALASTVMSFDLAKGSPIGWAKMCFLLVIVFAVTGAVVVLNDGVRKINVQHAKRIVGRRIYGGAQTNIPLRVNQGGVIPVIFASSVLMFPELILKWLHNQLESGGIGHGWFVNIIQWLIDHLQWGSWVYLGVEFALIVFFTYFYTAIQLNPKELSDNLKKYGGFIPGIKAGRKTADYIDRVLNRITLAGAIFLGLIALIPQLLMRYMKVNFYFGGTSLMIVVGVALDTVRQMESHMVTRHYQTIMR